MKMKQLDQDFHVPITPSPDTPMRFALFEQRISKTLDHLRRGGYRIPCGRGRQPWGGGVPTYKFAGFSQKLHEIKKSLVPRGGVPGASQLGSATATLKTAHCNNT